MGVFLRKGELVRITYADGRVWGWHCFRTGNYSLLGTVRTIYAGNLLIYDGSIKRTGPV